MIDADTFFKNKELEDKKYIQQQVDYEVNEILKKFEKFKKTDFRVHESISREVVIELRHKIFKFGYWVTSERSFLTSCYIYIDIVKANWFHKLIYNLFYKDK